MNFEDNVVLPLCFFFRITGSQCYEFKIFLFINERRLRLPIILKNGVLVDLRRILGPYENL